MQGAKDWQSSHCVPDFCCVRRYLFSDYLALADDCHMEVPVSMSGSCMGSAAATGILVKAVELRYIKKKKKQQLLGNSEKPAKYEGI